ncbi:hypothetical protein FB639_006091, partial [Coemansia asiatica]
MSLDPSEKQKKILAAKKKLKNFQAKRAATATTPTAVDDHPSTPSSPTATAETPTVNHSDTAQTPEETDL